jgi:hypothetical protein
MFLKPITGRLVPDPDRGDLLPEEGREVVDQQYWLRRLSDGDVEEIPPTVTKEPKQ